MTEDASKNKAGYESHYRGFTGRTFFTLTSLIALFVIFFCIFYTTKMVDKPFAGYFVNWRVMAMSLGQNDWPGNQAGLRYPDKILAINGQDISTINDFDRIIQENPLGTHLK